MDDSEPLDDEGHLRLPFAPEDTAHPTGDGERSRGGESPSEPVTVREYLMERWLPSKQPRGEGGRRHRGSLGVGTYTTYRGDLEAYVLPRIGDQRLDRLTPDDLDHLYDQLETNGSARGRPLSPKTIANVHSLLHKAFADAVRRGDLDQNPADAVEAPRARRPITDVWSVDELRTFLEHVRHDRFYAAWLLFATTGMRRGEVAGLAWDDLDLEHGLVRVRWTLGNINGRATWKPTPKTRAGERTMSLDRDTVAALEAHRERQSAERLAAGRSWTEGAQRGLARHGARMGGVHLAGRPLRPPRALLAALRKACRGRRAPDHPSSRPPAHVRDRRPPTCHRLARRQGDLTTPRARLRRHHARHLRACAAGRRRGDGPRPRTPDHRRAGRTRRRPRMIAVER